MTLKELLKLNQSRKKGVLDLSYQSWTWTGRKLTALPPQIGKLTDLTVLDLRGNLLTALPPQIGKLTDLTVLDLRVNLLTALPPQIGKLTKLTKLQLDSNQLTALPAEIGKLTNLTELRLSGNQLTALPPEIGKLTKLTVLRAYCNQLTALPPQIGKLTKLPRLVLHNNQLTALPPEIGKLTNLTELALGRNQLTALPPEIAKLTKLTRLGLDDNPLTSPPPEIISQGTKAILAYLREQSGKEGDVYGYSYPQGQESMPMADHIRELAEKLRDCARTKKGAEVLRLRRILAEELAPLRPDVFSSDAQVEFLELRDSLAGWTRTSSISTPQYGPLEKLADKIVCVLDKRLASDSPDPARTDAVVSSGHPGYFTRFNRWAYPEKKSWLRGHWLGFLWAVLASVIGGLVLAWLAG